MVMKQPWVPFYSFSRCNALAQPDIAHHWAMSATIAFLLPEVFTSGREKEA